MLLVTESTGRESVDSSLLTSSNVLALTFVQCTRPLMAGHWLGEALFRYRPFKPLVERSSRSTLTNSRKPSVISCPTKNLAYGRFFGFTPLILLLLIS
jgi:hypothetical protein